jgi:uncharacterized protein (TIGR02001 family)
MKHLKMALCAAAATVALGGAAMAQDSNAPAFSFNVGATSDYSFRGLTQTAKDPAVFGGADVTAGLFYAGAWASNVDWGMETDLYAGVKPKLGPVTFDLGAIYYGYPDSDIKNAAYWEGKVAASIPAGEGTLGLAYYYSPEFFGKTGKADYYELNGSMPLPFGGASISGAIGRQSLSRGSYGTDGYTTMNAGVTIPFLSKLSLDLRYVYTDDDAKIACVGCSLNKFIGTIKATF